MTFALALGTGLVLSLAGPSAQALPISANSPLVQDLSATSLTADQFNSNFAPIAGSGAVTNTFSFLNSPSPAGTVQSQVFKGTGAEAGLYAYAYQFDVNNVKDSTGQPIGVNSTSMYFNATPNLANLAGGGPAAIFTVNGAIGGLNAPTTTEDGVATPSHIYWQPGTTTGSLNFQYLDTKSGGGPLMAGTNSGTIVVLSTQPPSSSQLFVSLLSPDPQNGYPQVYSPTTGTISQVPAPEPATILAWSGMIGALALAHRFRRARRAA